MKGDLSSIFARVFEGALPRSNLSETEVYQLREKEALPILTHLGEWMQKAYMEVLPKRAMGRVLAYSLKRWGELMLYTTDGKLAIDNNAVDRSIRPVGWGEKTTSSVAHTKPPREVPCCIC